MSINSISLYNLWTCLSIYRVNTVWTYLNGYELWMSQVFCAAGKLIKLSVSGLFGIHSHSDTNLNGSIYK